MPQSRSAGGRLLSKLLVFLSTLGLAIGLVFVPSVPAKAGTAPTPPPDQPSNRPAPTRVTTADDGARHTQRAPLPVTLRAPLPASKDALRQDYDAPKNLAPSRPSMKALKSAQATAPCNVSDFTSRTGSDLVQQIRSVGTDCINTLFGLSGSDAHYAFRESQMTTVAYALRDDGARYPGDNSLSTAQIVLYLRAGYYVQFYHSGDVGDYGPGLKTAIEAGLDSFFGNAKSGTVSDASGEVLAESVTLIDSAGENARYLAVVKRMLNSYGSSYDAHYWMVAAVNNVYTILFRGHYLPEFVAAVQADPSVLDTVNGFATKHLDLLGTERFYLTSNAGLELGRFLQHQSLQAKVKPMLKGLLGKSRMTGPTAALWVAVAGMTDYYDKASCSYYQTCDLANRLKNAVLRVSFACSPSIKFRAQVMTQDQLDRACASLKGQDAFFHGVVKDNGAVADDNNTTIEVNVFHSSTDYQTYAGQIFGISTNNGGMYLEGEPNVAGNQPRFIAYEAEWKRPEFDIWNLNHEYTHYLDGRFDMYGDFAAGTRTPTVWWIEGFAEYISYSYRKQTYEAAIKEAGKKTYPLNTLFDTTYENTDTNRTYRWGYLAVRYMLEKHPADMTTLLGHYRTGDYDRARTFLTSTIGGRYNDDWYSWLSAIASDGTGDGGECTGIDTRQLGRNCTRSNVAATSGNYAYFYLNIPEGTAKLAITVSGGTGNADLYYSDSAWATTTQNTQRSTNAGNSETLTIDSPRSGYNYISLYADKDFSGITVKAEY
ncbi:collagenase [Nonomuraea sp. NPDC051941]|uniref:M9 family metallopeptidase n=1 Tax=Nonomuraea sp. NPDC051941 TaxID=3364373 RepID=UPI0037CC54F4